MSAILKFDFQKIKTITFFRRKVSKLHKKDTFFHVTIKFSLKQAVDPFGCPYNMSEKIHSQIIQL